LFKYFCKTWNSITAIELPCSLNYWIFIKCLHPSIFIWVFLRWILNFFVVGFVDFQDPCTCQSDLLLLYNIFLLLFSVLRFRWKLLQIKVVVHTYVKYLEFEVWRICWVSQRHVVSLFSAEMKNSQVVSSYNPFILLFSSDYPQWLLPYVINFMHLLHLTILANKIKDGNAWCWSFSKQFLYTHDGIHWWKDKFSIRETTYFNQSNAYDSWIS